MKLARPIRVIGVGSPLGDDALAWRVVDQLRQKVMSDQIEFYVVEGGQRILDVLDGRGSLVLIDALAPSGRPGIIQRFAWPNAEVEVLRPDSTHHLRPAEALKLAATLALLPGEVILWGMEGASFEPNADLSPAVTFALPILVELIADELGDAMKEEETCHA